MSNRAYLCCTPWRRTHPSEHSSFDPEKHTVAASVARVPLLWLAAFRASDLQSAGPLCTTKRALANLASSKTGVAGRSFDAETAMLADAIRATQGSYVTIELDEIADLWTRGFSSTLRRALGGDPRARVAVAEFDPGASRSKQLVALLGSSHVRDVPWEQSPKRRTATKTKPELSLRQALESGDIKAVRALLRDGADPNDCDAFGSCWKAVFSGKAPTSMLDELIRAGGDVDRKQRSHGPPLIQAIWARRPDMVRALLERGADPHAVDAFRRPAIAIAARQGELEALKLLLAGRPTGSEIRAAVREATSVVSRSPSIAQALALLGSQGSPPVARARPRK